MEIEVVARIVAKPEFSLLIQATDDKTLDEFFKKIIREALHSAMVIWDRDLDDPFDFEIHSCREGVKE